MRASLVIASHNEGSLIHRTVQSCIEAAEGLDCEIVVADDASTDGSIDHLRREFEQVRVIANPVRQGVSATKDLAARTALGDVLLFLDGHCKPEAGALEGLVAAVEEWNGQAIVTPSVAMLDVERWESRRDLVGHGFSVNLGSLECGWLGLDSMQTCKGPRGGLYYKQPTLSGCCIAMSRALYETLWGFDVDMKYYGSEDVDFGVKSWLMGYPVLHAPDPVIGHRFQHTFEHYTAPSEHIHANQLRMARKNLSDETWSAWLSRFDESRESEWWIQVWETFLLGSNSLERERTYLLANRKHDEFWHAAEFGLTWPQTENLSAPPPLRFNKGTTLPPSPPPTLPPVLPTAPPLAPPPTPPPGTPG